VVNLESAEAIPEPDAVAPDAKSNFTNKCFITLKRPLASGATALGSVRLPHSIQTDPLPALRVLTRSSQLNVDFVRMYEHHAAKEDTVIFPAWKQTLTEEQLDERPTSLRISKRSNSGPMVTRMQ